MLTVIKNGQLYGPEYLGKKDILITGERIGYIADNIDIPKSFPYIKTIDAKGKVVVPGFIDSHVHICGGGGEGSYKTRTPEIQLTDITKGGVTTVIGVLGTDGTTRTMSNLIAKARGLEEEGITTFVNTGCYEVPVRTLTGSIQDDIILIDKIIGVGEIAISDHRSSAPTSAEIARIAANARLGGILSGKAGVVNIHIGDGKDKLDMLVEVVENTDIPINQFIPTHVNRNAQLFEEAIKFSKMGGRLDLTTSTTKQFLEEGEIKCSKALKMIIDNKIPLSNITFTSDGQGSLPNFDENGKYLGLQIGKVTSLFKEVKDAIKCEGIDISDAIRVITSSPADIYKLKGKGYLKEGYDADLVLLDIDTLDIDTVIAKGRLMIENNNILVKGTFE